MVYSALFQNREASRMENNLSNPPTPPSSLPPTPPPSVQQKLVNGLATSEELTEGQNELEGQKDLLTTELKNMDMLASLPTPPHNQNEELRFLFTTPHFFFPFS
ncbi:hypothetical protein scyTo_0024033 [Scyliorhinus torazame]|uniref:Uncharacterized protein n=1 Tax=Scyliorhinus torazame TaxID=75743 RepID=A0A401QC92_SCYTO|nr:hypothetical protein [Scyliorhinus torazame]